MQWGDRYADEKPPKVLRRRADKKRVVAALVPQGAATSVQTRSSWCQGLCHCVPPEAMQAIDRHVVWSLRTEPLGNKGSVGRNPGVNCYAKGTTMSIEEPRRVEQRMPPGELRPDDRGQ